MSNPTSPTVSADIRSATAAPAHRYDVVVVGGGMIGSSVAAYFGAGGARVLLLERSDELLTGASYANQARVHNGYHYPRSLLTGLRSRVNFPRFVEEFEECVDSSFDKYYAIATHYSKVTAEQFATFCRRIEAEVGPAPAAVKALFDKHLIEDVFRVREYAFNALKLRDLLRRRLADSGVEVRTGAEADQVAPLADGSLLLAWVEAGTRYEVEAGQVINCTYSRLNQLLRRSDLPPIPLKHEYAEMALVAMPDPLKHMGITVMCGPFFSFMPFPPRQLHTFSHVRYTPHRWHEERADGAAPPPGIFERHPHDESNFRRMVLDAARYLPLMRQVEYHDSLWETKTVLPSSEADDSRPILFRPHHGLRNLTCILGGKIDNIYDVLAELEAARAAGVLA